MLKLDKPIREGFQTITPYIAIPEGERLIAFLKETFGAAETLRTGTPAGFHAEVRVGDSMLMIGSGESTRGRDRIGAFHVYLPDCDEVYRRAIQAGGESMGEPADRPYGERSGFVKDFAGNHWYLATLFPSGPPREPIGTVVPYPFPSKARAFIDFLKRAFGAEEMGIHEHGGRVMHAAARVGGSVLEMGEPVEGLHLPHMFFLYVENCDAVYLSALAAGAESLDAPQDRPYGRTALVRDPFGFEWAPTSLVRGKG